MTGSSDLQVFVLGHQDGHFDDIKRRKYLEFARLDKLDVGEYQRNDFGENRFLYSRFEELIVAEYIGTVTAAWNKKFNFDTTGKHIYMVDFLHMLELEPDIVWAPILTKNDQWLSDSEQCHPGITAYLNEISEIIGVKQVRRSIWCNNFICHREVMQDYVKFFKSTFDKINRIHNWQYNFGASDYYAGRKPAAIGERITMFYFSQRNDLELREPLLT